MITHGVNKRNSGFTLIEMMVGVTIFIIALGFIYGTYLAGQDIWELQRDKLDLQAQARRAIDYMSMELRQATRGTGSTPPDIFISPSPDNTGITFYLPPRDPGTGVILTNINGGIAWDQSIPVEYRYIDARKEMHRISGGEDRVMFGDIQAVSFTDGSIDLSMPKYELKINLALERTTTKHRKTSFTLAPTIRLRN